MPIHCILLVQLHSCRKINNGFVVVQEAVPDETSAIVGRCILRIELDHSIEVFQSKLETITTNFLPHCAQVVNGLDIVLLKLDRHEVVCLRLNQMVRLVPAECSIIEGLKVLCIQVNRLSVIRNRSIKVALLAVGEATVMVEVGFFGLDFDSRREALDCFVEVTSPVQRDSLVVVCVGVPWINLNRR